MHRSGFVNIIGNPNVGKSTLMNALVGERLSIITSKAQTTRHRIMGIVDGDDFQIVYSDTPGILKPAYKLQETMMSFVRGAVDDADVILYVTDTVEQSDRSDEIVGRIVRSGIPAVVVINKIDLTTPEALEAIVDRWHAKMPDAEIVPVSAKERFNMKGLIEAVLRRLPEGEPFYPKDTLTDRPMRFFASEIIREKIMLNYDKDIVIGHKGEKLKRVGRAAREDLERFLGKKVFLQLFVKVQEGWRDNERQLQRFGYDPQ